MSAGLLPLDLTYNLLIRLQVFAVDHAYKD